MTEGLASRRARTPLLVVALLAAGCGGTLPKATDPERAKSAFVAALDAWKGGEKAEALRTQSPPVYFNDAQWEGGSRLIRYEIESEQASGLSWRCAVRLTVQAAGEEPKTRTARYAVDIGQAVVIAREP